MAGAVEIADILVVGRMLIAIAHLKADGGAGGLPLEDAREQLYMIGLLTACSDSRLTWATTCHLGLQEILIDLDARRHTIDDTSHGNAMALAKGSQLVYVAESIQRSLGFWVQVSGFRWFQEVSSGSRVICCNHCSHCSHHRHSCHRDSRHHSHTPRDRSSGACNRSCPARLPHVPLQCDLQSAGSCQPMGD